MSKLTTGPFVIPSLIDVGITPANLLITLENPDNRQKTVTVYLSVSAQAVFPAASVVVNTLTQLVTLDPLRSTTVSAQLGVHYQIGDTVRVTIANDIDEDGEKIEATVVVANAGRTAPTTFFRHDDFVETDNLI